MKKFKIAYVDPGFCRIMYKVQNEKREKIFYCFYDIGEKEGIGFYRCSQDGEPSYQIKNFQDFSGDWFELPVINPEQDSDYTMNLKMRCILFLMDKFNQIKGE